MHRRRLTRLTVAALLGTLSVPGMALDYRAAAKASVLYDTPSPTGKKLYIVSADTPLEVVVTLEKWIKVRARDGKLAWIARNDLADYQSVMVNVDQAAVHEGARDDAPGVFSATNGVVLRVTGPAQGAWLPVRHADGETGFVRKVDVWGY